MKTEHNQNMWDAAEQGQKKLSNFKYFIRKEEMPF